MLCITILILYAILNKNPQYTFNDNDKYDGNYIYIYIFIINYLIDFINDCFSIYILIIEL